MTRPAARLLLALLAGAAAEAARAAPGEANPPVPPDGPARVTAPSACGGQAARYENGSGFDLVVTRVGEVRIENPLRPLTPEVTQVLQVVIAGKVATAYGADVTALRRGGGPSTIEAMLGGPIRWQAALPLLPDPIAIVADDGAPLAQLSFRACEAPPAVKAAPQAGRTAPGRGSGAPKGATKAEAKKLPPGFSMPQGAITQ